MNLIEKYGKKKVSIFIGATALAVVGLGTGIWYVNEQNHKEEVLATIDLTFKEDAFIEYGLETVDYNEYIKEKIGEPEITLPTNEIDTKTIAKHDVTYKVAKEGYSKDAKLSLEVKDTKAPEILIKEETVTLAYGSEYDIKENIEIVKDPIDGDVPYAETAGENNYYIVEGTVDTATSGDYTITIKAMDKNKVESEKAYTIHVNEEEVEETPYQQPTSGGSNYTPPVSNGGGSYTPPSNNGGNTTTPPATCNANGQWKSLGNSGYATYDFNKADLYGESNCPEGYLYNVITVKDVCGNSGWSVHYEKLN